MLEGARRGHASRRMWLQNSTDGGLQTFLRLRRFGQSKPAMTFVVPPLSTFSALLPPDLPLLLRPELESLLQRLEQARTGDPALFEALNATGWLSRLPRVLVASPFVGEVMLALSEPLKAGLLRGDWDHADPDFAASLAQGLSTCGEESEVMALLRRERRLQTARIAARSLAGLAPVPETLRELSQLAQALVAAAEDWAHQQLCARFGTPRDESGAAQRLVVLGMGKLGGGELNFSSDIDLIFAYPAEGECDGRKALSVHEFFTRVGQRLIRLLAEPTADGIVYRVDMRLRPFGDAGPLAGSFNALEDYYASHGREWERYALVKARPLTAVASGAELLERLRPFVYRRYLDFGAIDSIRALKQMIEAEMDQAALARHIKLGRGGIREIEFFVQAHQLIHGGRVPALRRQRRPEGRPGR